jgi:hypothetical protein
MILTRQVLCITGNFASACGCWSSARRGAVRDDYNFVRIHQTLRTTAAVAATVTDRLWQIGDIVDVLEAWEMHKG